MSEWESKSEDTAAAIPMPKESGDGNKAAKVDNCQPQVGHGKFFEGDWDPSTNFANPKGSGWDSKSEDA